MEVETSDELAHIIFYFNDFCCYDYCLLQKIDMSEFQQLISISAILLGILGYMYIGK